MTTNLEGSAAQHGCPAGTRFRSNSYLAITLRQSMDEKVLCLAGVIEVRL